MTSKQRKTQKNKGERDRIRLKKESEQLEIEALQEGRVAREEIPMPEDVEKGNNEAPEPVMPPGPTSFEELDEEKAARAKAEQVQQVTYETSDLVWNILHTDELSPTEKSDRIMDVADGFAERVNTLSAEVVSKDIEQLQVEALLATYRRGLNIVQKAQEWAEDLIIKRELSSKERKRLQDGDFALPEKRKYPIHDKAHVRNALARAAQMIASGGEAAADAKAALPKIRAAARKFGIEVSKAALLIEKDRNGDWRWIGKPSNNFMDWQGDIMSKAAHQEYVEFLNGNPEMAPQFLSWHTPGTARTHPVDFWMEHEGALIMSGKLTEAEAGAILKMQAQTDLGMSVQGLALRDPQNREVIEHYWLYEVSDLPLEKAANPFTSLETIAKEAGMDKLQYLTEMMGSEEKAKAFLEKTGQMQKELADAGLTSKEQVQEQVQEPVDPPAAEPKPVPALDVDALTKQIADAMGKQFDFEGLNAFVAKAQETQEKVALLEGVIQELVKQKDDEIVEMLTPPIKKWVWSQETRPSARKDTVLKEDDKEDQEIAKANPGVPAEYWLSELTNTVPVDND